jgi:hypothetical protein
MLQDEKPGSEPALDSGVGEPKLDGSSGTESVVPDFEARGRIRNKKRRASQLEPVHASELRGSFSKQSHPLNRDPDPSTSSTSSSPEPPRYTKKTRRRSDAEPDHTLRGRARDTRPIEEKRERERSRSRPPSRHRSESANDSEGRVRRQRSLPNIYHGDKRRRDSMAGEEEVLDKAETKTETEDQKRSDK